MASTPPHSSRRAKYKVKYRHKQRWVSPHHEWNQKDADEIEAMAQIGLHDHHIAVIKDRCEQTILNHYGEELKRGRAKGIASLLQTAHMQALGGNISMLIFLLKTRAGLWERQIAPDGSLTPFTINIDARKQTVVRVPEMPLIEDWNKAAKDHQAQILGVPTPPKRTV